MIRDEITEFWFGLDVNQQKLALDADTILMVFIYILCHAQRSLPDIFAQLVFCKEFSTPFVKSTKVGYSLTTLEIALTLLSEQEDLIDLGVSQTLLQVPM